MKSLSAYSIVKVLHNQDAGRILIGIETFNATSLDRRSNHYSQILGERLGIAMLGNNDATGSVAMRQRASPSAEQMSARSRKVWYLSHPCNWI